MMTRKAKRMLIIIPIAIVIIALIAIFVFLYLNTDMFKPAKTLFSKYVGKNLENVEMIQEIFKQTENEEMQKNKYIENCEVIINYTNYAGTSSESMNNRINKLKLVIDGQVDKSNKYEYQNVQLLKEDNQAFEFEYIKNEENTGIRFSDLFKQYIFAQDTNFKGLLEKIGYKEDELENIPETIDINNNILNGCEFSDEEIETLKQKYLNVVIGEISGDKFKKVQKQNITINDKKVEVEGYVLKLSKEQLNNIYVNVLEELKKDEIILGKLDTLQDNIKIINQLSSETVNLRDSFISELEDKINEINENNIGSEETSITVYKNLGKTVRTTISGVDYDINFDFLEIGKEKFIQIDEKKVESEDYNFMFKIESEDNKIGIELEDNKTDKPYKISIEKEMRKEDEETKQSTSIIYDNNTNKLEANIIKNINYVDEFENELNIDEENIIELDSLSNENLDSVSSKIQEALKKKIESIKQEVIREDDINEILGDFGLYHTSERLEGSGTTETEKNRFNSKFEILQGEELDKDRVISIIDTIKDNFINLETSSSKELKLEISRNKGNNELTEKLKKYIEEKRNNKYSINVEYDNDGIVKYVVLKILQ